MHIEALSLDHTFYQRHLFVAWLASHRDVTVGRSADECHCPLAHFYSLYYERPCRVLLSGQVRTCEGDRLLCDLPAFARTFMLALDFTYPFVEISGAAALELLHEVRTVDQVVRRVVAQGEESTDRNVPLLLSVGRV